MKVMSRKIIDQLPIKMQITLLEKGISYDRKLLSTIKKDPWNLDMGKKAIRLICLFAKIDIASLPNKPPSNRFPTKSIDRAIALLSKYGYSVSPPSAPSTASAEINRS